MPSAEGADVLQDTKWPKFLGAMVVFLGVTVINRDLPVTEVVHSQCIGIQSLIFAKLVLYSQF